MSTGSNGARLSEAVPRYTSYPTAPHFHPGVDAADLSRLARSAATGRTISLYVHIPYCDRLCWFCACHTKHDPTLRAGGGYLQSLQAEIARSARPVEGKASVRSVHFGGGSPTMLKPEDIVALDRSLRAAFDYLPDAEISVEIDPNDMDDARFDALAAIGMTRASLGVQDFDPKVQKAINREQSFEQTKAVVDGVARARRRDRSTSTCSTACRTRPAKASPRPCEQALSLEPDRIALFGYAHVPWFKKHQTMIDEAWLAGGPAAASRNRRPRAAISCMRHGYQPVGLDHFAQPDDSLAWPPGTGRCTAIFRAIPTISARR